MTQIAQTRESLPTHLEKALYTAKAHTTGGRGGVKSEKPTTNGLHRRDFTVAAATTMAVSLLRGHSQRRAWALFNPKITTRR
jgi:hypothetical protein